MELVRGAAPVLLALALALQRKTAAVGPEELVEEMQVTLASLVSGGPVAHLWVVELEVSGLVELAPPVVGRSSPKACCDLPMRDQWLMRLVESKLKVSPLGSLAGHCPRAAVQAGDWQHEAAHWPLRMQASGLMICGPE